jgi:enediyne biosynthesis protein E4
MRALALLLLALPAGVVADSAPAIHFEEIGEKVGARLEHHTRAFTGPYADVLGMFTSGGAAVAVADFDGDGDEDLFVTDSGEGRPCHLLRNDLDAHGSLHFTDVAARAGVAKGNEGHAIVSDAVWFDADDDGWPDLLVARFGTPILYHNERDGTFRDVTAGSGLDKFANTIAVIAFDYDNDGRLDLLFGNYFKPVDLFAPPDRKVLPNNLDSADNGGGVTLWRNVTEPGSSRLRFVDVTAQAGLAQHTGWTLDVGHGDFDDDGFEDLYFADDYGTDRLYLNRRDGTFRDVTREAIGLDSKKGMNVEVADYDHDGRLDIYVTNITDEYMRECNMLWHNDGVDAYGHLTFTDVARETGTCNTLWGWAAKFGDFDDDGWEDLFAVDGLRSAGKEDYVTVLLGMILRPGVDFSDLASWPKIGDRSWSGYQKKKLFRNLGGQTFKEVSAEAGVDNQLDGRGIAVADFDNDGRLDLYQTNANQPSLLYHGQPGHPGHWIELKLAGTKSNRDAIGARVQVRAGGQSWLREVDGGNGYASQSSRRVHVGLGAATRLDALEVRWPSGRRESFTVAVDRITTLTEGKGEALARPAPGKGGR